MFCCGPVDATDIALTSVAEVSTELALLSLSQSNVVEGGQSLLEAQTKVPSVCVRDDSPAALRIVCGNTWAESESLLPSSSTPKER